MPGDLEYFANAVSSTYFETTGTRVLAGRAFTAADADDQVILSEAFARLLWGEEPAVGRRMRDSPDGKWKTVVGVAGNVESHWSAGQRSDLQIYIPLALPREAAAPASTGPARQSYIRQLLVVRASAPTLVAAAVRAQIRLLDPDLPVGRFTAGTDIYAGPFAEQQLVLSCGGRVRRDCAAAGRDGDFRRVVAGRHPPPA